MNRATATLPARSTFFKLACAGVFRVAAFAFASMAAIELERHSPHYRIIFTLLHAGIEACLYVIENNMAERGGFEPPVELVTLRRFSKPLLSTTQPPLRLVCSRADFKMVTRREFHEFIGHPAWCDRIGLRAPVAQLDRAFASGAKGQRFESSRVYQLTLAPDMGNARTLPLLFSFSCTSPPIQA